MKNTKMTKKLVEGAIMISLATVLSLFKLAEMPYGGSITLASMLPMVVLSYRYGVGFGLGCGVVYATLQQLLGINHLSYFTTWQSVLAVILLDYILAFVFVGLGGIFRGRLGGRGVKYQPYEMALGMCAVCIIRYALHTVAGCTVWAGLSIPTEAALVYSIGYNATYMIPETLINVAVSAYVGRVLDFSKDTPTRVPINTVYDSSYKGGVYRFISMSAALAALIFATVMVFPKLQHPDTGSFTFEFLGEASWVLVGCVSGALLLAALVFLVLSFAKGKKE
jgi:thiamine transporter